MIPHTSVPYTEAMDGGRESGFLLYSGISTEMNGEKALTVNYEFKLELDKQMTIGSFQSK